MFPICDKERKLRLFVAVYLYTKQKTLKMAESIMSFEINHNHLDQFECLYITQFQTQGNKIKEAKLFEVCFNWANFSSI